MLFDLPLLSILLSNTVKIAFVHHGNQHISDNGAYALTPENEGYVGNSFHNVIDTHLKYNIPVDIHMSGTLMQSYAWMENDNGLLAKMRDNSIVELVGGSYSEHIMPYTPEDLNLFSCFYAKKLAENLVKPFGSPGRPIVVWIPERVWKDEYSLPIGHRYAPVEEYWGSMVAIFAKEYGKWDKLPDGRAVWFPPVIIVDGDTAHAWYHGGCTGYTSSGWDIGSNRIHRAWDSWGNHVLVAFIDRIADEHWVAPYGWDTIRSHVAELRATGRDDLVVLYGDDWEKAAGVAGWDGSMWGAPNPGGPSRTYDGNIASLAAYGSYEGMYPIHLSQAGLWYGVMLENDNDPTNDPPDIDIFYTSYPYVNSWTGGTYDYWYNDIWTADDGKPGAPWGKESVHTTQAYGCENAQDLNKNGIKGDYEDLWLYGYKALKGNGDINWDNNDIEYVGWVTLLAQYYETGWHDAFGPNISGWEKNLLNHTRHAAVYACGASWQKKASAGEIEEAVAYKSDVDGDGEEELVMYNDKIYMVVEPKGGRVLWLFTAQGDVVIGNSMSNWYGEGDWDDGVHPGLFHDSIGWNRDYTLEVTKASGDSVEGYAEVSTEWGGYVKKVFHLSLGAPYIEVDYVFNADNWAVGGLSPDIKSLLENGYALSEVSGTLNFKGTSHTYFGVKNEITDTYAVYMYSSEYASSGEVEAYNRFRFSSVAQKVELHFPVYGMLNTPEELKVYFYAWRGAPSDVIDLVPPASVSDLKVEFSTVNAVKLSWNVPTLDANGDPLKDLKGFSVFRAISPDDYGVKVGEVQWDGKSSRVEFVDNTLKRSGTYYYYVLAYDNSRNYSPSSGVVSVEVKSLRLSCNPYDPRNDGSLVIENLPYESGGTVVIDILDSSGRKVASSSGSAGSGSVRIDGTRAYWDGVSDTGKDVLPGLYFVVVRTSGDDSRAFALRLVVMR